MSAIITSASLQISSEREFSLIFRFKIEDRVPERLIDEKLPTGLPLAFIRMPALSPALREPMPGYVDKLRGPTAVMIGAGHVLGRSNFAAEIIPVDLAANTFLVTAWDVGSRLDTTFFYLTKNRK